MQWILVLLIALLSRAADAAESPASIDGTIAEDGKPVAGALVAAIAGQATEPATTTRSDAQGRFRLGPLAPGKYGVTATAAGHTAGLTLGVAVAAGKATHADVQLGGEALEVTGSIVDDLTGEPLQEATLLAARVSEVEGDLFAIELKDGSYRVRLPRAQYTLLASAKAHAAQQRSIDGSTTTVSLRLPRSWPAGPAPAAVVDWMRAHAVPLTRVEAGSDAADLQPLAAALGSARILGLGEATHGTREFFQLKHRLLEWLVREHGVNVFAIEATMPEAFDLNQYVLTGRGDPQKALAGLYFWTWDTEEVLELIRWMRHWNEDPKHAKVKFYGFDMHEAPRATKFILDYVTRVAPSEAPAFTAALAPLKNSLDVRAVPTLSPDALQTLEQAASRLLGRFDAARVEWTARSTADAWAVAQQHARVLVQYLEVTRLGQTPAAGEARDRAMADNITWIAEHEGPQSKLVVWAHDFHVSYGDTAFHPMGQFLRTRWGKDYRNVGFAFDHGGFRSGDRLENERIHPFQVPPLPAGSFDATLNATGLMRFILDLRTPREGVVADWFNAQHGKREITESYNPKGPLATTGLPTLTGREFDLIAFIAETTAARGLPEGNGGDRTVLPEPQNLGFEELDGDKPRGFLTAPQLAAFGYELSSRDKGAAQGSRCALLRRLPGPRYGEAVGEFQQRIDAKPYRGKQLRLTAAVRAKVARGSSARLTLQARAFPRSAIDTMSAHPIVDAKWQTYSIELAVPANAATLSIGGALVGEGEACFDDFRLEVLPAVLPPK